MITRLRRWSRYTFEFVFSQGFVQVTGMLAGLIYVRVMPVEEYALYAISLGTLSFISVASDLGLTGSLYYFWRRCRAEGEPIEPKIMAVRKLRLVFLAFATIAAVPMFLGTTADRAISIKSILTCLILIIATASVQIYTTIEMQLLRLKGSQTISYYCEGAGSAGRLAVAFSMIITGFCTASYGLSGSVFSALIIFVSLRFVTAKGVVKDYPQGRSAWREIAVYVIPLLPSFAVYLAQDPIVLFLTAKFGGLKTVSEASALGRIGAVFSLIGTFVSVVIVPKLAQITDDWRFLRVAGAFLLVLLIVVTALLTLIITFPSVPLKLIGDNYSHLTYEITIIMLTSSINIFVSFIIVINRLRGWLRLEPLIAITQLCIISVIAVNSSFSETRDVLLLNMHIVCVAFVLNFGITVLGIFVPSCLYIR